VVTKDEFRAVLIDYSETFSPLRLLLSSLDFSKRNLFNLNQA